MNKILMTVMLTMLSLALCAKEYKPVLTESAQWTDYRVKYGYSSNVEFKNSTGETYQIVGDTLLYGKNCKIVESRSIIRPDNPPSYSYWFEEDGRLFTFFDDSMWDMIKDKPEIMERHDRYYPFFLKMDMNLDKGESPYGSWLSVVDIDTVEIAGRLRKRISLGKDVNVKCRWIEGLMPENDYNDTYSAWWSITDWVYGVATYSCGEFTVDATIFGAMGNTVREDKIWEYEDCCVDNTGSPRIGFSGECYFVGLREINGISYKILNCYHDKDHKNYDQAFLREKDGKVYINLTSDSSANFSENEGNSEALLYDFNANPGDTYVSLNYLSYDDTDPLPVAVTVTDTCTVAVGNKLMKCQTVRAANSDTALTLVEGLGIINGGWFHRPFWTKPASIAEGSFSQLNNVRNRFKTDIQLEDEIIFKNRESLWKPQFIRQDRMWEYAMPVKGEPSTSIYCRMKFDGKREVNGKTYDKFITVDIKKIERHVNGSDTICTMTYLPYEYVERLMREENNTVYYLTQAETDLPEGGNKFNAATWDYEKPITEHPFYDFTPEIGNYFIGSTCLYHTANFWIEEISEVIVDGKSCRLLYAPQYGKETQTEYFYPSLYFLESIGTIGKGASMTYIPEDESTGEWFTLSRVFNNEGMVIFPLANQKYPLGWETGFIPEDEGTTVISSAGVKECVDTDNARMITFSNNSVKALGSNIVLYDITGKVVKEGMNSISTEDLSSGMYIAKASGNYKTLKIIVKNI